VTRRAALFALAAASSAACVSYPSDGTLLCSAEGACPSGLTCACGACWATAPAVCGSSTGAAASASSGGSSAGATGSGGAGETSGGSSSAGLGTTGHASAGSSGSGTIGTASGGSSASASGSATGASSSASGGSSGGQASSGTGSTGSAAAGTTTSSSGSSAGGPGGGIGGGSTSGGAGLSGGSTGGPTQLVLLAGQLGGSGNLDGVGSAARFNNPRGVALDEDAGVLYVADSFNCRIRKVVLGTDRVSTLSGRSCTGALPSMNALALQSGVLFGVGNDGNLWRFDTSLGSASVQSFQGAGSLGPNDPIAGDGQGNVFVSVGGGVIALDVATGASQDVAGLSGDYLGLADDGAGDLFLGALGCSILEDDLDAGTISTLSNSCQAPPAGPMVYSAGSLFYCSPTGIAGFPLSASPGLLPGTGPLSPCWPAIDGSGNLYIASMGRSTVSEYSLSAGPPATAIAGLDIHAGTADGVGAAATFFGPGELALDGETLYVSDGDNERVRAVDVATAAVTTLDATEGVAGLGLALDASGVLYVASPGTCAIAGFSLDGGTLTPLAGSSCGPPQDGTGASAVFNYPSVFADDGAGTLYVVDRNALRQVALATGQVVSLNVSASGVAAAGGGVYVSQGGSVFSFDPAAGTQVAIATGFSAAGALALDGLGGLYVADDGDATVQRIDLTSGAVALVAGSAGSEGVTPGPLPAILNQPAGLAPGPGGTLFISDGVENAILEVR